MIQFLLKRFIGLLFVIIGVTFITFIMGYFAPGDPVRNMLGSHFDPRLYWQLKHQYGLDLPWYQQYYNFIVRLLHLDLGLSYSQPGRPVWDILKNGMPISVELDLWALVLQFLVGIPLGVFSALKANTWLDTANMGILLCLYAIPSFVLSVLCQVVIVWLDLRTGVGWPILGWGNPWHYTWSDIQYRIVPILVLAAGGTAYIARLARTSTLEVLGQDYIRTARAKGLTERIVVYRHALRNALIPLVTIFGVSLGFLVTGTFFIEKLFDIPGIAQVTITSITARDYPVIQATVIMLATTVVIGNLISDLLYTLVDPRIKVS